MSVTSNGENSYLSHLKIQLGDTFVMMTAVHLARKTTRSRLLFSYFNSISLLATSHRHFYSSRIQVLPELAKSYLARGNEIFLATGDSERFFSKVMRGKELF